MRILLSNDDGVAAKGLSTLAKHLQPLADITVVAPERDRSAVSNSLTLDLPLRVFKQENGFIAVNGTPADAVHLALTGFLEEPPNMVIAGINSNANLGDDVLYSGTVAAAMEGRFLGFPAMAISMACPRPEANHYESGGRIAALLFQKLLALPLPKETLLNVNVPDLPFEQIKGIKVTRLGHRHMAENVIASQDAQGKRIYWIGPAGAEQDAGPGTDFHAVNQGYVSITPIKTDLTDYSALDTVQAWTSELGMSK
ncbi:MAG: 5'/3'-nucleotidase SurE [Candidatus Berkiella sp.]